MGIQAIGGKNAYVYAFSATRCVNGVNQIYHSFALDAADSVEEAEGRAMRIAKRAYPLESSWHQHFVMVNCISGIESIGRIEIASVKPGPD